MRRPSTSDWITAGVLLVGYVALCLLTVADLGYARDEGFYFAAAASYERWFEELAKNPSRALEPSLVDRYWSANHEHPAFMKALFALSHRYLHEASELISEPGTAFRFPGIVVSALAPATLFVWARQLLSMPGALVAALAYAAMPRVFFHSHLAAFDAPVASLWLLTTYAYWRAWSGGGRSWVVASGVLYGVLLDTKHNAWLLPPALLLHLAVTRGPFAFAALIHGVRRGSAARRSISGDEKTSVRVPRARLGFFLPRALVAMAILGPLVFYALWPWIWHDTWARLEEYAAFHLAHAYYNIEFLGTTYWKPPFPRLYAWVMTLATVPAVTLLLFLIGVRAAFGARVRAGMLSAAVRFRGRAERAPRKSQPRRVCERQRYETYVLWAVAVFVGYAPWLSAATPIFGGTKHWITSYPFLCLFAGLGFRSLERGIAAVLERRRGFERRAWLRRALPGLLSGTALAGPVVMTLESHPFGLSSYTPIVGGAPGAASLGLNRTFWGYTTGSLQDYLSSRAPHNAAVYVHDTALQSFNMLRQERRVRPDLRGTLELHRSEVALYHHEPHMGRVEYEIWVDYGTTVPAIVKTHDGVPVVWAYERPIAPPGP